MVREVEEKRKRRKKIPDSLVREWIDGKPFYYKGYKDVLNKNKSLEDIIGSSTLQALIVTYLVMLLGKKNLDNNITYYQMRRDFISTIKIILKPILLFTIPK